jgi:hypothetical protein
MELPDAPSGFPPPPPTAEMPPPPSPFGPRLHTPPHPPWFLRGPWLPAVLVVVLLAVVAAAIAAPLVASRQRAHDYSFLERRADGSPVRWSPCAPIHYVTNLSGAPQNEFVDVQEAIRRVTAATGIRFVYDGPTGALPRGIPNARPLPTPPGEDAPPVLIAWLDGDEFLQVGGGNSQVGLAVSSTEPDGFYYDTGFVALNGGQDLVPGFGVGPTWGPVILHELGHIMGLGHVPATDELMNPQENPVVTDFGVGDLAGLRVLGRHGSCAGAAA